MKHHGIKTLGLVVLVILALPAFAQDDQETDPLPEDDTILGTWWIQFGEDELLDEPFRLVFEKNGTVKVYEDGDREETAGYLLDENQSKITIYEDNDPTDIEVVIKYSFVDDLLIFLISDGDGRGEHEERFELTRNPEGTEQHQRARKDLGEGKPGVHTARKTMTQLRGLHQGAVTFSVSAKDTMPPGIGELVVGDYVTPEYILPPTSKKKVPKGFDDWEDAKKRDWANKNTGYVFLRASEKVTLDIELIAFFELPASKDQKSVYMVFDDNHAESHPYADADKLIKKQTGYTLEQWMKSKSPGTGAAPPKEEKEEKKQEAEEAKQ
ncbi:MAG: hypothetical protein AAGB26_17845 [Planctomycetota bacterium]